MVYAPSALLVDAQIQVEVLELFIFWDTNKDEHVVTSEVVYALNEYCRLSLPPGQVANILEQIAHRTHKSIASEEAMLQLDSAQFVMFMNHELVFGRWKGEELLLKIRSAKEALENSWALNNKKYFKDLTHTTLLRRGHSMVFRDDDNAQDIAEDDADEKQITVLNESCCDLVKHIWVKLQLKFVLAVLVWLFLSTAVLVVMNKWNFSQSVYYSIQSGFSIGFGVLNEWKEYGLNHVDKCSSFTTIAEGRSWIQNTGLDLVSDFTDNSKYSSDTPYKSCVYVYSNNEYKNYSMAYTIVSCFFFDSLFCQRREY